MILNFQKNMGIESKKLINIVLTVKIMILFGVIWFADSQFSFKKRIDL